MNELKEDLKVYFKEWSKVLLWVIPLSILYIIILMLL